MIDIKIECDVIYSSYDVTQKMGVMSYKSRLDVSVDGLMIWIQWVPCLIQGLCCHARRGCDIVHILVWCDRVGVMSSA